MKNDEQTATGVN